jgi:SAM-dependent methyltransferase
MKKIFEEKSLKELIDAQLKIQVDIPWPEEAECLAGLGLQDAKRVLDIGTGNGYFLSRLAQRYPDKEFVGVEVSEQLARVAANYASGAGITNMQIVNEACPTDAVAGPFDFAFARLAIYCSHGKNDVLAWCHELLKPGGTMALIETDFDFCWSCPADDAWKLFFDAMIRFHETTGYDPCIGKKLPHMLLKAGFRDVKLQEGHWYSSIGRMPDEFVSYWKGSANTIQHIAPDIFTKDKMAQFHTYLKEVASSKGATALSPMFIASGVK